MTNIIKFFPRNAGENPGNVLEQAAGDYESLIIIGFDKAGDLEVRSSTNLNTGEILWAIDRFKHKLMNGDYDVPESE